MKIEIGESLVYSWLRHVKGCEIVQTNWKASKSWEVNDIKMLEGIIAEARNEFNLDVFGNNSLTQFIGQAECDAIGINNHEKIVYAVEIAFHKNGLDYGSNSDTYAKVIEKCIRNLMCMHAYFKSFEPVIIFASPKIGRTKVEELSSYVDVMNRFFEKKGFKNPVRVLYNTEFRDSILSPVIEYSKLVSDSSELFLRSIQMLNVFNRDFLNGTVMNNVATIIDNTKAYSEYPVGVMANDILRSLLEEGKATETEIGDLLNKRKSRRVFGLGYPVLTVSRSDNPKRYYALPLVVRGKEYYLCSQWREKNRANLEEWIVNHIE